MIKHPCVYILTNKPFGVLYTGVTSNLIKRIYEHKVGLIKGFTQKYNCKLLVFYEIHENMISAIEREKQIKSGSRNRKVNLIKSLNPEWNDLFKLII